MTGVSERRRSTCNLKYDEYKARRYRTRDMSKIFDFVKPGVITGDDVQKVFQVAKENNFKVYEYRDEKERQEAVCSCAADPVVTIKTF